MWVDHLELQLYLKCVIPAQELQAQCSDEGLRVVDHHGCIATGILYNVTSSKSKGVDNRVWLSWYMYISQTEYNYVEFDCMYKMYGP